MLICTRHSAPLIKGWSACTFLKSLGPFNHPNLLISSAIGESLQIPVDKLSWHFSLHTQLRQSCGWFVLCGMCTLPIQKNITQQTKKPSPKYPIPSIDYGSLPISNVQQLLEKQASLCVYTSCNII